MSHDFKEGDVVQLCGPDARPVPRGSLGVVTLMHTSGFTCTVTFFGQKHPLWVTQASLRRVTQRACTS